MVNPFKEIDWNPDRRERRKFAFSLIAGCPAVAILMLVASYLRGAWNPHPAILVATIGFSIGALLWMLPQLALPFYVVIYAVSGAIGMVVSNALLTIFFYTIITFAACVLKVLGRVPLRKQPDPTAKSYWKHLDSVKEVTQYYRQY